MSLESPLYRPAPSHAGFSVPQPETITPKAAGPTLPVTSDLTLEAAAKPVTLEAVSKGKWEVDNNHKGGQIWREADRVASKDPTVEVAVRLLRQHGIDDAGYENFIDFKAILPGETKPGDPEPKEEEVVKLDTFVRTVKGKKERCYCADVTFQVTVHDPQSGTPKTIEFIQKIETSVQVPVSGNQRIETESLKLALIALEGYRQKIGEPIITHQNHKIQEVAQSVFYFVYERDKKSEGFYAQHKFQYHPRGFMVGPEGSVSGLWLSQPWKGLRLDDYTSVRHLWGKKVRCEHLDEKNDLLRKLVTSAKTKRKEPAPLRKPPSRAEDLELDSEIKGARKLSYADSVELTRLFNQTQELKDQDGISYGLSPTDVLNILTQNTYFDRMDLDAVLPKAGDVALDTTPLPHTGGVAESILQEITKYDARIKEIRSLTTQIEEQMKTKGLAPNPKGDCAKPNTMSDADFSKVKSEISKLQKERNMAFALAERNRTNAQAAMETLEQKYKNVKDNPTVIRTLMSAAPQTDTHPLKSVFKTIEKNLKEIEDHTRYYRLDKRMETIRRDFSTFFDPREADYLSDEIQRLKPPPGEMPKPVEPAPFRPTSPQASPATGSIPPADTTAPAWDPTVAQTNAPMMPLGVDQNTPLGTVGGAAEGVW